jgi:hypothetical protein
MSEGVSGAAIHLDIQVNNDDARKATIQSANHVLVSLLNSQDIWNTFKLPTNQARCNVADFPSMQTTHIRSAYASCSPMTQQFSEPSKDPMRAHGNNAPNTLFR